MNVGDVGSSSTRCRSMASQTASGERSRTVMTQPPLDRVCSRVLSPPMWSKSRKAIVRKAGRGTLNFSRMAVKSWTAALLLPLEPDENRTSPGLPSRFSVSMSGGVPVAGQDSMAASSPSPMETMRSTAAMSLNSGFFPSTEWVSGTTMQRRSTRASSRATAFGEKSASMLTTEPACSDAASSLRRQSSVISSSRP